MLSGSYASFTSVSFTELLIANDSFQLGANALWLCDMHMPASSIVSYKMLCVFSSWKPLGFGAFLDERVLEQVAVVPVHFVRIRFCHQGHGHSNDGWYNQRHDEGDHTVLRVQTFWQDEPVEAAHKLALHNNATGEDSNQPRSTANQCTHASRTLPRAQQHGTNGSRAKQIGNEGECQDIVLLVANCNSWSVEKHCKEIQHDGKEVTKTKQYMQRQAQITHHKQCARAPTTSWGNKS